MLASTKTRYKAVESKVYAYVESRMKTIGENPALWPRMFKFYGWIEELQTIEGILERTPYRAGESFPSWCRRMPNSDLLQLGELIEERRKRSGV